MKHFLLVCCCFFSVAALAQQGDIDLLRKIYQPDGPKHAVFTLSQSAYPITILCPVLVYTLSNRKDTTALLNTKRVVYSMATAAFFTYSTKWLLHRARPYESYADIIPYQKEIDPSFPSGHTSMAFNTAMNMSMLTHKNWIKISAFAWASAIGYSRLYLGEHYPSDVLAGALVGAGSAYVSNKAQLWLLHRKRNNNPAHAL